MTVRDAGEAARPSPEALLSEAKRAERTRLVADVTAAVDRFRPEDMEPLFGARV